MPFGLELPICPNCGQAFRDIINHHVSGLCTMKHALKEGVETPFQEQAHRLDRLAVEETLLDRMSGFDLSA